MTVRSAGWTLVLLTLALTGAGKLFAGSVSGVVTSRNDGQVLSGMTVAVYTASGQLVTSLASDISGRYSIQLAPGTYRILAYDNAGVFATSFYDDAPSFEQSLLVDGNQFVSANFSLWEAARLSGNVTAQETGFALAGMTVAAYNLDGTRRTTVRSALAGDYVLLLPPGDFKLVAYDETGAHAVEFYDQAKSFEAAAALTLSSGEVRPDISFSLVRSARVSGLVRDELGRGLTAMVVTAYDTGGRVVGSDSTDVSGRYEMLLPPGEVRLVAHDPTGLHAPAFGGEANSFETSPALSLLAGSSVGDVSFRLVLAGFIRGVIRAREGHAPLGGVTIAAYNEDGTTRGTAGTDGAGAYRLVLPPGQFRVAAYDEAHVYVPAFAGGGGDFASAQPITVVVGALLTRDIDLVRAAHLRGTVSDSVSSVVLAGITIDGYSLTGSKVSSATTDSAGRFALPVPAGTYKIVAYDPAEEFGKIFFGQSIAFEDAAAVAVTTAEERPGIDLQLTEAGRLHVRVKRRADAAPLAGMRVSVHDSLGRLIEARSSDSLGEARMALTPAAYRIAFVDESGRYATQYYDGASSFSSSTAVVLTAGRETSITALVSEPRRRRLVRP